MNQSRNFRFDVVITVGRYKGYRLNEKPLTGDEALKLSRECSQRGCPQVEFNYEATRETIENAETLRQLAMLSPLTHRNSFQ